LPSTRTIDVRDLRRRLNLSRRMFARLAGYSERAVADWENGKQPASGNLARLTQAKRLYDALAKVMEPDTVGNWLETPNKAFGKLKPIEVIERGETDRIWRMIYFLQSGVPV
jgi:transcriptional regulator with XRE-family HTH domain